MTKSVSFAIGVTVGALAATFLIRADKSETRRLQETLQRVQSERDEIAKVAAEKERLVKDIEQARVATAPLNEPSAELLRLRGEVGRLQRELNDEQREKTSNLPILGDGSTTPLIAREIAAPEIELDRSLDIPSGSSTNEVLVALQRAGAQLVTQEQGLIQAGISVPNADGGSNETILMEFYFDHDILMSKKYARLP